MSDDNGADNHQSRSTPNDVGHSNNVETSSSSNAAAASAAAAANDRLYERKSTRKLVRVLTVVAYVFFVSLAAIMLSLYYIFLWDPAAPERGRLEARVDPRDNDSLAYNASSKC